MFSVPDAKAFAKTFPGPWEFVHGILVEPQAAWGMVKVGIE